MERKKGKRVVKGREVRRREIVQRARELFNAKGYEKVTMESLMKSLRVAKGTIYHYFKSKDELLEAVCDDIIDESVEKMAEVVQKMSGSAQEKLRKLVEVGNVSQDESALLEELHKPGFESMHTKLLAKALKKQAPFYAELIKEAFATENSLECAEFILAGFQFLTDLGIYPWTKEDLMRRKAAFPRLIERMLNASEGSFAFIGTT